MSLGFPSQAGSWRRFSEKGGEEEMVVKKKLSGPRFQVSGKTRNELREPRYEEQADLQA